MVERELGSSAPKETKKSTLILRRIVPHAVTIKILDKLLGEGLTDDGHKKLKEYVGKILKCEPVSASRDFPTVYSDADFDFQNEGMSNLPDKGSTLYIGNHTRGGPLYGMAQYFEVSKGIYNARDAVFDKRLREPAAIAQRGLTKVLKLPTNKKIMWQIPFTGQFYELAINSLDWISVSPPKFDAEGQIVNKQKLPQSAVDRLLDGGALLWLPQGRHQDFNDLGMPNKSMRLLSKLKDSDVQLVAVRFVPGEKHHRIIFSNPVHIQDVPCKEGQVDTGGFVAKHLQPLK